MPKNASAESRNAVIYARYSSHNQSEQSIEGQLRDAYDFAQREGYVIVGEYIDRAVSGKTDDRPDFQRMLADAPKHQFQFVLVWKLDRFARNRMEAAFNRQKLSKHGIKLISVKENISDAPEGIIMESMLEALAEYYSANLAQNIKRGMRESSLNGRYTGGSVPFGYKLIDGKLLQDELTAPLVKRIFEDYAGGKPKAEILDELRKLGIKSPRGRELGPGTFADMLNNAAYCGEVIRMGIKVDCIPDPIISKELFNRAQIRVQAHKHAPAASKAKVEYLLQGKAFCGFCGGTLVGESGKGRKGIIYNYYSCRNRKKTHTCQKANEKKDIVEATVVREAIRFISKPENLDMAAKGVLAEYEKEFGQAHIKELEKKKDRLEADLNNVVEAIAKTPGMGQARLIEKLNALEAQKNDLEIDIAKLKIAQDIRLSEAEIKAWLKQFAVGDPNDPNFRKWVIDTLVNAVYLFDRYMIIYFNLKGSKQVCFSDVDEKLNDQGLSTELKKEPTFDFGSDFNGSEPPMKKSECLQGFQGCKHSLFSCLFGVKNLLKCPFFAPNIPN